MTPPASPSASPDDRRQNLRERLRPLVEKTLDALTDELADTPDHQLFGDLEFRLRDHVHELAAAAHATGLEDRKKGGIKAPASTAPRATPTPASSATATEPC